MKRIATFSLKGGVGKTTTAINISHAAARQGTRTLLWDLDPQGAASYLARVKQHLDGGSKRLVAHGGSLEPHIHATAQTGLHVVPADLSLRGLDLHLDGADLGTGRLAELLEPLTDRYDVCIIDCPGGLTLASEAVFAATDALLVPTIPATLSIRAVRQLLEIVPGGGSKPLVIPFISMIDRRKRSHRDAVIALAAEIPALLTTQIPSSIVIERTSTSRTDVAGDRAGHAIAALYEQLWSEVAERLW